MGFSLLLCIIVCVVVFFTARRSKKKTEAEHASGIAGLKPGSRIRTINGMLGYVTEVSGDRIRADFSPDQSGSIIEITKDAYLKTEE